MEDIFEDLQSIPWADLSHAYGKASDVPLQLKDLVSEEKEKRQKALYELCSSVCHQGTIYEVTSYVVPFLVRILRSHQTPDREFVAGLLAAIANGSGYFGVHAQVDSQLGDVWEGILSRRGLDLEEQLALEETWVTAVREAVDPHLDLLYEFIQHKVWDIRFEVASALGKYPDHAKESLEILRTALEQEEDEEIREALRVSIILLEGQLT
jgi:HEAT repeat protein